VVPDSNYNTVLMADDDAEDCMVASEAFAVSGARAEFSCVLDGMALMNHLTEHLAGRGVQGLPSLILLDLNMPRKDGREALVEIKAESALQHIPVVILTTSEEEKDIAFCMKAGATAFITKPATFDEWVKMMKSLAEHWLQR
jgi:CheY-like chemotaxis protein